MLKAPFPYFGGKSRVAAEVWSRFGAVRNYVEPFFGSGAVLLQRPLAFQGVETVNDKDGLLANFWRVVVQFPDDLAHHADWPVNEADLHARHLWLVGQRDSLTERLMADPDYCDPKAAGWWAWGCCAWIGSGWCSGDGPWNVVDGALTKNDAGRGINRQLPHLSFGQGINRKLPHVGNAGRGDYIRQTFAELHARLRDVRVACGDWQRILGDSVLRAGSPCGILLDPPYDEGAMKYSVGGMGISGDVRKWCKAYGERKDLRIALCGYEGHHDELEALGWSVHAWKTKGGYGSQGEGDARENSARERIWFSPHCLSENQGRLF